MLKTSEHAFESVIEAALLAGGPDDPNGSGGVREVQASYLAGEQSFTPGGYLKRSSADYNAELALIPRDLFDFVQASQPKMWDKLLKIHKGDAAAAKAQFLKKLAKDLNQRGTLALLRDRKGFRLEGCKFRLIYFKPVSGLNPETQKLYQANRFSVLRQLYYKPHSPDKPKSGPSIDLGLLINGLPLFTAELKNQLTGQSIEDARRQYREDRHEPNHPLLAFGRCLAHFAVDNNEVEFTTHLNGPSTRFFPLNQGYGGGKGNPPSVTGFATAYLWEQIWAKDSVLNLLQQFIHEIEVEDDKGQKTGERRIIFPRYHQIDAVRRLVQDAAEQGTGQKYLIQHSAGSGKTYSIAWLSHQLSVLHNRDDAPVFNSVIVITDRRVLDRQLQQNIRQFEQVDGVVENIDKTSRQLKQALADGKKIIVTTLQKFPVVMAYIRYQQAQGGADFELAGQKFAIIVDEAHSSQSGESSKSVHQVLTVNNLADDSAGDDTEEPEDTIEDRLTEEAAQRKLPPNVSLFAFTATPKQKTMELFGTLQPDGSVAPFSLYSMRHAIEEGFILDVLENYTTYKTYWNLLKTIQDDPHYDRDKAARLLKNFVEEHQLVLDKKVAIIVEHLATQVIDQIEGQAKAMLVTRSRRQAVRYKLAIDQYLQQKGYDFNTLVAFSGTLKVHDGGEVYSEANMNGFPDSQTAETFKQKQYRLMIVANKFQTGFDQPLLHTMYVDKRLGGVNAVQTLSRLNRIWPPAKIGTAVVDFVNEADDIQKAFKPYYDRTILSEKTDPNLLYGLESRLDNAFIYTGEELDEFTRLYFTATDQRAALPQLHTVMDKAVARFNEVGEETQANFRKAVTDYVRLYAFLAQTARFEDPDLEKLYHYAKFLARKLPRTVQELPAEIRKQVNLESLRVTKSGSGQIDLARGQEKLKPISAKDAGLLPEEEAREALSRIIHELNTIYGFPDASDDEIVTVVHLETRLDADESLKASAQVNSREHFRLSFDNKMKEKFQELIEDNFKLYKKIVDDPDFAQALLDAMFERFLQRHQANGEALGGV